MVDDGARRRKGGRRGEYKVKQEGGRVCGRVDREVQGTWLASYVCGTTFFFWRGPRASVEWGGD